MRCLQVPARPEREPQEPRCRGAEPWSSAGARSSVRRACRTVPGTSPRTRARAERYSSIAPGRRRYSSSSATTISAGRGRGSLTGELLPPPATVRRPAVGPQLPRARRRTAVPRQRAKLSMGLTRTTSSGSPAALEPAMHRGLLPGPAHGRDRQLDQVRRPAEILGGQRVADGLRTARRSAGTTRWPAGAGPAPGRAARRAAAPAARRQTDGGSDTTGGGHPAGPGTGSPAPAPPAWPCRRPAR